jgi:hypothetical protein
MKPDKQKYSRKKNGMDNNRKNNDSERDEV